MEHFNKAKAMKLRSHLGKYLVADDDKLCQSKQGATKRAVWEIELIIGKSHCVRLKSSNRWYLTATDATFLLGVTENKVVQANFDYGMDWKLEWEPITDGFHMKLRSWCGKYLRGNSGMASWRNSVTHNWILCDLEPVHEFPVKIVSFTESKFSSLDSED